MIGQRKQRYILDFDDVLKAAFMTTNTPALIAGLNQYGNTPLSPNIGGMGVTGSGLTDGQLLAWNAADNMVVSSGITPSNSYTKAQADAFMAGKTTQATVISVTVTNGGSGYTTAPSVTISGGSGSGATAVAVIVSGVVTSVIVTNGGSGYATAPGVAFGSGSATATAVIDSTSQTKYELNWSSLVNKPILFPTDWSIISNKPSIPASATKTIYLNGPILVPGPAAAVTFAGGAGGSGASGTATVSQYVLSVPVTAAGTGYNVTPPTVGFTGGGGSGTTATAVIDPSSGAVISITIVTGGSGYTSVPTASLSGGSGTGATVGTVVLASGVTSIAVGGGGTGYSSAPTVNFTGGGVGVTQVATAVAAVSGGAVVSFTVTNPGMGYSSTPGVSLVNSAALVATGYVNVSGGAVVTGSGGITLTNPGAGYGTAPSVSIFGAGSGATATATVGGGIVTGVNVSAGGSGYVAQATTTVSFAGGTGAVVVPTISSVGGGTSGGPILALNILNGGSGYLSGGSGALAASITDSSGHGAGAAATATVTAGVITAIQLTSPGSGYRNFTVGTYQVGSYTWVVADLTTSPFYSAIPAGATGVILYAEMAFTAGGAYPAYSGYQLMTRANSSSFPFIVLTHFNDQHSGEQDYHAESTIATVPIDPSLKFQHQLVAYDGNPDGILSVYILGYTLN